ncbi:MAG: D-lyxose/D-mannose family sugar isomerase [Lentisphaeria bacterium]|nr:D-lyxose/D-mannose family sugar isomerase [Lentisphaeria bacterium]
MKRSEINREIRLAEEFFASFQFKLPPFAAYKPEDWRKHGSEIREIFDCELGWDLTDFGRGDFRRIGLLLFTIRNGKINSPVYTKPYAEKIMISRSEQVTLMHCHESKTEDIINRGGGRLVFELFNRKGSAVELDDTPVTVSRDGESVTIAAGEKLYLEPGQSITLKPNLFHKFYAEAGSDVMIGEVSAVNDDHNDNVFHEPQLRFPVIEEDEPPYRLLVSDLLLFSQGKK